ncbi:MAG: hypothetical protein E4H36_14530 [Spirochaetales bacterium]|nr:MAG: hypothetical protein E4H36_14530 [Spirochaetales bacterium]
MKTMKMLFRIFVLMLIITVFLSLDNPAGRGLPSKVNEANMSLYKYLFEPAWRIRSVSADPGGSAFNSAAADDLGSLYAAGFQFGTGAYSYGEQSAEGTAEEFNIILVKYDSSGTALWARTVSAGSDFSESRLVASNRQENAKAAVF